MQDNPGPSSILIVDDQQIVRQVMRSALQGHGYELMVASDGNEALELCRAATAPMHLAIVDIMMPGLSTSSLLSGLRQKFPEIRVLLTSGYPRNEAFERAGLLETDGRFIPKPFTVGELRSMVRNELSCTNGHPGAFHLRDSSDQSRNQAHRTR